MNLDFLFDGFASALSFLYDLTSSYGLSIMLLTLGVMIIVTPLTLKSTRSMIAMQQMQPEIRKLQNKYKDDRQKLNEEMMAFYKDHDISPLGGCLPLIVQTPIFIILYQVLVGLTRLRPYGEDMGTAVGLLARDPNTGGLFPNFGTFDPKYLDHTSQMYRDLSVSRTMPFLGLDLADSFMQKLQTGVVNALPYAVLVGVVAVSAWFQQRQIMARNAGNQTAINPQQQMIMKVMPFFLPFFSLTLPAGIVLYFVVSNGYRIAQQAFITRTMYSEEAKAARDEAFQAKLSKSNGKAGATPAKGSGSGSGKTSGKGSGSGSAKGSGAKGGGAAKGAATSKGARSAKAQQSKGKGAATTPTSKAPMGRGRARDRVELAKADAAELAGGSGDPDGSNGSPKGSNGRGPSRQAPSRTAPQAQNRSKSKKKRR